ncbi:MAG: histidine--tRNA ligase [Pseudomonadota bacterium]
MAKLQAIRGMHDILMQDTHRWQFTEKTIAHVLKQFGYQEIRLPIVEYTDLFTRSIGDHTDIVTKEMYCFDDRNESSLTLRPEGTAGCVRAGIEHGLFYNQTQRLWYQGPMFRHERPQKGRQRQFHQIGVEAFGFNGPDVDAEMILMCAHLWQLFGIKLELEINSLGTTESRNNYRKQLVNYFSKHRNALDKESLIRLENNPLRILDSKNPDLQSVIQSAPMLSDYLDEESALHFEELCGVLDSAGIDYKVNPRLVRGLDYYGKTVFEWITSELGAQGTVCAGGRYDGLVELHGARPTPAVGFAIGMERLIELINEDIIDNHQAPHIYLIIASETGMQAGLLLADKLRKSNPDLRVMTHLGAGSIKSQFKKADKSGAKYALILGDEEINNNSISVKDLRGDQPQQSMNYPELENFLDKI